MITLNDYSSNDIQIIAKHLLIYIYRYTFNDKHLMINTSSNNLKCLYIFMTIIFI